MHMHAAELDLDAISNPVVVAIIVVHVPKNMACIPAVARSADLALLCMAWLCGLPL